MSAFSQFERVSRAEIAAEAAPVAPPAVPVAAESTPAVPTLPAKPRLPAPVVLDGPLRTLTVPLAYPLGYAGREYHTITLRRPTSAEVGRFFETLVASDPAGDDGLLFFPVFYAQDGEPVPAAVLANLDDDDRADVMGRVADFLPRRLLALTAASPSASGADTGADTAPTSST